MNILMTLGQLYNFFSEGCTNLYYLATPSLVSNELDFFFFFFGHNQEFLGRVISERSGAPQRDPLSIKVKSAAFLNPLVATHSETNIPKLPSPTPPCPLSILWGHSFGISPLSYS